MAVLSKAESLIRRREMTGWRVPPVQNYVQPAVKTVNAPAVAVAAGVCPHFAQYGSCNKGVGSCERGSHPTKTEKKASEQRKLVDERVNKTRQEKAAKEKKRASEDVMVAEVDFVPPKPLAVGATSLQAAGVEEADDVLVSAEVTYKKGVVANCRVCHKDFKSDEQRYLGKGLLMPKTCPPCCAARAQRMQETALMVEADYSSDEEGGEVMMVLETGLCSYYAKCEAMAMAEAVEEDLSTPVDGVQVALYNAVAVGVPVASHASGCVPGVYAVVEGGDRDAHLDRMPEGNNCPARAGALTPASADAHCVELITACAVDLTPASADAHCVDLITACAGDLTPASAGAHGVSSEVSIPWIVMQQLVCTIHGGQAGAASELFREKLHHMTLRKIIRESVPEQAAVYVDDWLGGMSIAWCQAVVRVMEQMISTEGLGHLEHGTADEEMWVNQLKEAVLKVNDDYANIEKRWITLNDGSMVPGISARGEKALRRCFKGVLYVMGKKMRASYDARWVRTTSMFRLVSKDFAATVSWYGTQEPVTRKLRDFNSGRQRTLGEFFEAGAAGSGMFLGWKHSSMIEAMKPVREIREYRGSFSETVTADDALASQFAILQMDPAGGAESVGAVSLAGVHTAGVSTGNSELDARVMLDMAELRARLSMATVERSRRVCGSVVRSKRVCQQITPMKAVWDTNPFASLAEEFEAQESDSSDESVPGLEDVEVLEDDDQSVGSEYWEAMVDSDLSDATVRTNGGGDESSDSDFH
jgi:hypothetical protein